MNGHILGHRSSGNGLDRLAIYSGVIYGFGFFGLAISSTTWLTDGKIHDVRLIRSDGVNTRFVVDGITLATVANVLDSTIDSIGSKFGIATGVPYFDGRMADLEIWNNGTAATGTKVVDSPIDENWTSSASVANRANPANPGTVYNITSADKETFLNKTASYEAVDGSPILVKAYV